MAKTTIGRFDCGSLTLLSAALILALSVGPVSGTELMLASAGSAGTARGEPLVRPDCANSPLKIDPCQPVAQTWLDHLNSRGYAFQAGFAAAGHTGVVTSAVLDCSFGIRNNRTTRLGGRWSRHAYAEACDGDKVTVNGVTFDYQRAVRDAASPDRAFFVAFLDNWGMTGPGCDPRQPTTIMGWEINCTPIVDNCGVIDWRERGVKSQYGQSYHLSYCYLTDLERAYE